MSRKEQIESFIEKELGLIINREIEIKNCLITITFVKADPDLKTAQVGVSILPSNMTGTSLRKLRKRSGVLARELQKKTRWRRIPTLIWKVDRGSKRAEEIQKTIKKISEQKNDNK